MTLPPSSTGSPPLPFNIPGDLSSQRVRLRRLHGADAEILFALYSDPVVMRYWNHAPWTSVNEATVAITEANADYITGASLHCAIEHRITGRLIGCCALYEVSRQNRCASVGYLLSPEHWGQGLVREAMQLLLGHAFGAWNLNRVEAEASRQNIGSCLALERMGFQREGLMRERWIVTGEKHDTVSYALLRDEWFAGTCRASVS